jgi:hypothetical protein
MDAATVGTSTRCPGCTKCYAAGVMREYEDIQLCPRCMKHPKRAYTEYLRRLYGRKEKHD